MEQSAADQQPRRRRKRPRPETTPAPEEQAPKMLKTAAAAEKEPHLVARILEHHRCPITQQLLVDPVIAEDGHVYERKAVEQWLIKTEKSPVTNKPMGPRLVAAIVVRQTVSELVEADVLENKVIQDYFMERGRLRATRLIVPGPDLEGAKMDFHSARARETSSGSSGSAAPDKTWQTQMEIVEWMQQGVELFSKSSKGVHQSQSGDLRDWLIQVARAAVVAVTQPLSQRLTTWEPLTQGTRVRLIDDPAELQRLCKRPAPGARDKVGWVADMASFAGQYCTVEKLGDNTHMNYCVRLEAAPEERGYSFPFDTVIVPA